MTTQAQIRVNSSFEIHTEKSALYLSPSPEVAGGGAPVYAAHRATRNARWDAHPFRSKLLCGAVTTASVAVLRSPLPGSSPCSHFSCPPVSGFLGAGWVAVVSALAVSIIPGANRLANDSPCETLGKKNLVHEVTCGIVRGEMREVAHLR